MRSRIISALAATAIAISGSAILAAPSSAAPPAGVKTYCIQAGPASRNLDWNGRDPKDCKTTYWVEKDGKKVLQINIAAAKAAENRKKMWAAMQGGYDSAQDWCDGNSLSCTIVTSVGVTLLGGILTSPSQ